MSKKTVRKTVSREAVVATSPPPPPLTAPTTLEEAEQAIRSLITAGVSGQWRLGFHYNNIVDKKLAEANGYADAQHYVAKQLRELAPATIGRYASVARAFSEAITQRYGLTKLALLLSYEKVAQVPPVTGDPGDLQIPIPTQDGGLVEKTFAECSSRELGQTLTLYRKSKTGPLPGEQRASVLQMEQAMRSAAGPRAAVRLTAHRRGSATVVSLEEIPLGQLPAILQAVIDACPPGTLKATLLPVQAA